MSGKRQGLGPAYFQYPIVPRIASGGNSGSVSWPQCEPALPNMKRKRGMSCPARIDYPGRLLLDLSGFYDAGIAVGPGICGIAAKRKVRACMTTERSFRSMLWTLAILGLAIDLGSKYAVFRALGNEGRGGEHVVIPGVFRLIAQFTGEPLEAGTWRESLQAYNGEVMPRVNHGALFGMGNAGTTTANGMFMLISVVAALAISIWSMRATTTRDGILCAALGLILGGTLGNLFDRAVFHGVRDFLYFHWFEWPVFNVADCCLVCGAGLLLLQALWPGRAKTIQEVSENALTAAK